MSATFGIGISSALVIDLGATSVSVSCIEDGFCVPSSRVLLPVGGDQVTRFFHHLLRDSSFPYAPCHPQSSLLDFELLNEMKERFCTLRENDLNVNICDFYVRRPGARTLAFQLKTFDEVILAPMVLYENY